MKINRSPTTPRARHSEPMSIRWALVMIAAAIAIGLVSAKAANTFASSTGTSATDLSQSTTPKFGMAEQTSTVVEPTVSKETSAESVVGQPTTVVAYEAASSTATAAAATSSSDQSSTVVRAANRSLHTSGQSGTSNDESGTTGLASTSTATANPVRVSGSAITEVRMVTDNAPSTLTVGSVAGMSGANLPANGKRLAGGSVQPGIVMPSGAKFYIPDLTLVAGGAAGVQLALENHSKLPIYAQLDVTGLPSDIEIAARSISTNGGLSVVRVGPRSFMIKLEGQTVSKDPNLEIQLIARGPVEAGTYQPNITLSGVSS